MGNELSFLHVNIRSLTKNISLLEELLISFKISPDIVGICETKLNKNTNISSVLLHTYKFNFLNSESNAGGVGLYIKSSLIYSLRTDLIFFSSNFESVWIELSTGLNNKKKLVGLIYCHPGASIADFTK